MYILESDCFEKDDKYVFKAKKNFETNQMIIYIHYNRNLEHTHLKPVFRYTIFICICVCR